MNLKHSFLFQRIVCFLLQHNSSIKHELCFQFLRSYSISSFQCNRADPKRFLFQSVHSINFFCLLLCFLARKKLKKYIFFSYLVSIQYCKFATYDRNLVVYVLCNKLFQALNLFCCTAIDYLHHPPDYELTTGLTRYLQAPCFPAIRLQ